MILACALVAPPGFVAIPDLFGGFFAWGGFLSAISVTAILTVLHRNFPGLEGSITKDRLHDLGKMIFAFSIFWMYLFFSQYIVIWYGKLPWEQAWIIRRSGIVWGDFSTLTVVLCFLVPFIGLMGRQPKMRPAIYTFFACVIMLGLWLERYGMVAPSVHHEGDPIFTIWQPLIGLMFLGLYVGSVRWFLSTFPAMQIWQPMVDPESLEAELPIEVQGPV